MFLIYLVDSGKYNPETARNLHRHLAYLRLLSISHIYDILVITETKTDSVFPLNQFAIQGYSKPYRFDRNRNGGGVFIYSQENIPSRKLKIHNTPDNIESTFIKINLIKTKWLFCCCYHPPSQSDQ